MSLKWNCIVLLYPPVFNIKFIFYEMFKCFDDKYLMNPIFFSSFLPVMNDFTSLYETSADSLSHSRYISPYRLVGQNLCQNSQVLSDYCTTK